MNDDGLDMNFLCTSLTHKAGHSGYPKNLGRVIRVVENLGIKNCYPIFAPKKQYPKIRVRV
jgi:hypothetical protein